MTTFAVNWDYRCPFARNAHEHVVAGLATGLVIGRLARKLWPKPVDGHPLSGLRAARGNTPAP